MVKKQLAALGVALALLAVLEPAAGGGVKFSKEDLKSEESLWQLYERWGARYNVARDPVEKLRRFDVFKDTARLVHLRAAAGQAPGLNVFADLSDEEFSRDYKCRMTTVVVDDRRNLTAPPVKRRGDGTLPLPVFIDWRAKSCKGQPCLGPVKLQGRCGSCWAFAATGALESHYAIRGANNRGPVQLSEQELVDCDTQSDGCKGGEAVNAFDYMSKNGLASSAAYPYRAKGGTCQATATSRVDLIMRGYETVPAHDEFQLLQAVTYGPVAISIAVGDDNIVFQDYEGGVYRGPCGTQNDHAMLLVGYGYDYYILKNSYGDHWGDEGYMILPRDFGHSAGGTCGILREGGSYPEMGLWALTDRADRLLLISSVRALAVCCAWCVLQARAVPIM